MTDVLAAQPSYDGAHYAARVASEREIARAMLAGAALWQAYCYADNGTRAEVEARLAWTHWLDTNCRGDTRHPLANAVRYLHDQLGARASELHRGA